LNSQIKEVSTRSVINLNELEEYELLKKIEGKTMNNYKGINL
jgi:hypothetical protein